MPGEVVEQILGRYVLLRLSKDQNQQKVGLENTRFFFPKNQSESLELEESLK